MTVQDDKVAGQEGGQEGGGKSNENDAGRSDGSLAEMPEVGENAKNAAAEMMEAYKDKPTIVLPGSGGAVSGTAVNEWLDDEGNPRYQVPDEADAAKAEEAKNDEKKQEQIEQDKALDEKLKEAAGEENKGEKD
ncbi:MAG: hypothetical protein ACLQIK_19665 [Mycobacterium sp.]|uniref:hypothetical protein n=1 Tax=Mycobacterium sp. TaxID=1785 RepID=UPI003F966F1C